MKIVFKINGISYEGQYKFSCNYLSNNNPPPLLIVNSSDFPIHTILNKFIRETANLTGTKFMCREGGCGSCIVTIKEVHPVTKKPIFHSIPSIAREIK